MSLFGDLWTAAANEAKIVEGEIVDTVHLVEAKVAPYIPGSVVSTVDQAKTKLVMVGSNVIDYVAGNPAGSLQKGIAEYKPVAASIAFSTSALSEEISTYQANLKKLNSWRLTLQSLSSMADKAKAPNLVKAIDVWGTADTNGGYIQGRNANQRALDAAQSLLDKTNAGLGIGPSEAKNYDALKPGAAGGFDNSNSYAKRIYEAVLAASQKAATADIPTAYDYAAAAGSTLVTPVVAPVTGAYHLTVAGAKGAKKAAGGVVDFVAGASKTIESTVAGAAASTTTLLKYASYALLAVGGIYALSFIPHPPRFSNPPRRRRARR